MLNRVLELHDSTLAALVARDDAVVVQLRPAYFHSSDGIPATDPGEGSTQDADLVIDEAVLPSPLPDFEIWIGDGLIRTDTFKLENILPIPFALDEPLTLELTLADGQQVVIRGTRCELVLYGKPTFLE